MTAKNKKRFICNNCGSISDKWSGKCEDCNEWNCIEEDDSIVATSPFASQKNKQSGITNKGVVEFEELSEEIGDILRYQTGIEELDKVVGGGLVEGSVILISGDPGIGKSTIMLQLVSSLSNKNMKCYYVSGEESVDQIKLRAKRLNIVGNPNLEITSTTMVSDVISQLHNKRNENGEPQILIVDSIQTMYMPEVGSAPGTVSQVRASTYELFNFAKKTGFIVIIIGHVTKDGQIAGPKVLEHMVDTVLNFEGDNNNEFRIIRSVKNRFGAANEIAIFEMKQNGLEEVKNPSKLFLSNHKDNVSGNSIFPSQEGSRTILVEIQSLLSLSPMANPRRAVVGWDLNRLSMIIAVLSTRYGVNLASHEVYLNIAGGLKITEPASDLAVAASLISSITNIALPPKTVVIGEIGLSGEIRAVSKFEARIKEAIKLGFKNAIVAHDDKKKMDKDDLAKIELHPVSHIRDLKKFFS